MKNIVSTLLFALVLSTGFAQEENKEVPDSWLDPNIAHLL
ncbi:MAG: hypothetical protein ACJA0Q_000835 [Saprospiraceae bacterium]|jgi:hypothetical protein